MNAASKVEADKLAIWNALSKTDPAHTKGFNRAGGFKGTAIKPIWIIKMLTEHFGPCGEGWGMGEPSFQVVPCEGEVLVFCTVSAWHGSPENQVWGVGGDKVQARRKDGFFCDDEAFKKAFTDAIGNAFKFVGVGADVHMGLFEDSKYLAELHAEFEARNAREDEPTKLAGITKIKADLRTLKTAGDKIESDEVGALETFNALVGDHKDSLTKIKEANHGWWTGDGEDFEGFKSWIIRRRAELSETEDGMFKMLIDSMKECDSSQMLANWMATNETLIEQLDGAEGRKFEMALQLHESALKQVATVAAG
jgi:hypothetical protein